MREVQGKVWGETQPVFELNNVEIHRITIMAGGYCSKHKHAAKYNRFCLISGLLDVEVWKNDYSLVDRTQLQQGESMTVPPGEFHRFRAIEPCDCLEIYWVEIRDDDIQREEVGGV